MSSREPELVPLGAVTRPHGVRGELRVHRFNPDSPLLLEQSTVWLRGEDGAREVRVLSSRPHKELVLLTLEGVVGREAAEALRGREVCVPRDALPPPDEDEVYHIDLLGLSARLADGTVIGEVAEVIRYPSADCLLLLTPRGKREVPLLSPYVVDVDLDARVVIVAHLEDLDA